MPRGQTKTPVEKAQQALTDAETQLAKKRTTLAKAEEAIVGINQLRGEVAYDERHVALLRSHPLLSGAVAADVGAQALEQVEPLPSSFDPEVPGQESFFDEGLPAQVPEPARPTGKTPFADAPVSAVVEPDEPAFVPVEAEPDTADEPFVL